jgi:putative FmdB family regulatory protein
MPIYDVICDQCGKGSEVLVTGSAESPVCPHCGGTRLRKLMSPTSSLTGRTGQALPGAGDTTCCGSHPGHAGCAGPGSCCGKANP